MEELFEVIIALIVIIGSLAKTASKSKKIRENAPGKAAAPAKPAAPVRTYPAAPAKKLMPDHAGHPAPAGPTIRPTVHPTESMSPVPDFWKHVSEALSEEPAEKKPDAGHGTAEMLAEGDSRECEHGSLGGSMAYEGHAEGRDKKAAGRLRAAEYEGSVRRPVMNAQEMQRAVVMAEILKRPQERMNEQARRWSVR